MAASGRPEVRRAHIAALAHIPRGTGIRMSLLADRLGVTKGAATQLVAHLERCGYLERLPDPSDGRAVIVRPTQAADAGYELARQRLADLEEGWERHVGTPRWQVFKDVLEEIANLQDRAAATVHPD